jgi:RNA polymerase sigma-70 factor (ECF subfamily)
MPAAAPTIDRGQLSDKSLLRSFQSGDDCALEALFERYEGPLFRFLVGVLRDQHAAEDALQETWCRALSHLDEVDGNRLRGWLFTVAYRQAMLCKRRQKAAVALTEQTGYVDPNPGPYVEAEKQEALARVRQLLEDLPPGQREVIRQRIYEGKRFRDIAATLGCPVNTALARMHEGLKRLRILWRTDHG